MAAFDDFFFITAAVIGLLLCREYLPCTIFEHEMNIITNDIEFATMASKVLEMVPDPETGLSVIDLGLIYQLDVDKAAKMIFCSMTLTTRFCPMGEAIIEAVERALKIKFPGHEIKINLTFDPPWTSDRISPKGKTILNQ